MKMNCNGIDVGQKELVVVISVKGKSRKAKKFKNTPTGFISIIHLLSKLKGEVNICLEVTD